MTDAHLPSLLTPAGPLLPAAVLAAGPAAAEAFAEFFAATIRNPNTRAAYLRAVRAFLDWLDAHAVGLAAARPLHVAAYVELFGRSHAAPTVKQHLAAIRMLYDHLCVRRVAEVNPAAAVRGPKHSARRGKTPVLEADEARRLLAGIETDTLVGLRDRALIGLMVYTFARVGAAVGMDVGDYFPQGKRWWVRLHEKGGKRHEVPAHHKLEEYLDAYLHAAGIANDRKGPLLRSADGRSGRLSPTRLTRQDAWALVRRRAETAGIGAGIGCHSFRATGITNYLTNGGTLEKAQQLANHESARTTKLYDRRDDPLTLDEVERISI